MALRSDGAAQAQRTRVVSPLRTMPMAVKRTPLRQVRKSTNSPMGTDFNMVCTSAGDGERAVQYGACRWRSAHASGRIREGTHVRTPGRSDTDTRDGSDDARALEIRLLAAKQTAANTANTSPAPNVKSESPVSGPYMYASPMPTTESAAAAAL